MGKQVGAKRYGDHVLLVGENPAFDWICRAKDKEEEPEERYSKEHWYHDKEI